MDQNNEQLYLGKGWSFPPSFDQNKKEVDMVPGVTDIEQSLQIILSTRPGERLLQPSFGCNLDIMLFEPVTATLITLVRDMVRKAILFYEARIDTNEIDINTENLNVGIILIDIEYTVRSTNSRFNFVYPFYLEEAIDISRI